MHLGNGSTAGAADNDGIASPNKSSLPTAGVKPTHQPQALVARDHSQTGTTRRPNVDNQELRCTG
jgi:hypothetical protein